MLCYVICKKCMNKECIIKDKSIKNYCTNIQKDINYGVVALKKDLVYYFCTIEKYKKFIILISLQTFCYL